VCDCVGACVGTYSHYLDIYKGPKYMRKSQAKIQNKNAEKLNYIIFLNTF